MSSYIEYLVESNLFEAESKDKVTLANNIRDYYIGTCEFLATEDEKWLENNSMLEHFYEDMFLCDGCGWYCEIYEMQDNGECLDCND